MKLSPYLIKRLAHSSSPLNRWRARRINGLLSTPPVEFYYEAGDPHSHLAAQLLPRLLKHLDAPLKIFIVSQEESLIYPELERQRRYNLEDARRIAPAYGLTFPAGACLPSEEQRLLAAQELLKVCCDPAAFVEQEKTLSERLFSHTILDITLQPETSEQLALNNARREHLGHYLPAMWQFNGQWFWGVDRFHRLIASIEAKGLWHSQQPALSFNPENAELPAVPAATTLECFLSFRSPYSFIAATQLQRKHKHLSTPLDIRPVLPMAMRGFKVPIAKRLYILRDAAREASRLDICFGYCADPIGDGALRALKAFSTARNTEQKLDFIVSAGRASWSEAIDLATDDGLRKASERAGLEWSAVQTAIAEADIDYAEENRDALFAAGLWGVPAFKLGDFATWGQDRLWMLEEILRRQ